MQYHVLMPSNSPRDDGGKREKSMMDGDGSNAVT
jgi:hypothetical protein